MKAPGQRQERRPSLVVRRTSSSTLDAHRFCAAYQPSENRQIQFLSRRVWWKKNICQPIPTCSEIATLKKNIAIPKKLRKMFAGSGSESSQVLWKIDMKNILERTFSFPRSSLTPGIQSSVPRTPVAAPETPISMILQEIRVFRPCARKSSWTSKFAWKFELKKLEVVLKLFRDLLWTVIVKNSWPVKHLWTDLHFKRQLLYQ